MSAHFIKLNIMEKSQIVKTSEEYYNRDRTFEYKVVFWCIVGLFITLLFLAI